MEYAKDDRKDKLVVDYSGTYGRVDKTAIYLINSCRYLHKDEKGVYTYVASLRPDGLVQFTRVYK